MEIRTIEKNAYDILVVGGGIAGVCAAVCAARQRKKTLLIEKTNQPRRACHDGAYQLV